jgi:hypothetical protein
MSNHPSNVHLRFYARFLTALLFAILVPLATVPAPAESGISRLVVPTAQTPQEQAVATMFVEEAQRRTLGGVPATVLHAAPETLAAGEQLVLLADRAEIASLLPATAAERYRAAFRSVLRSARATGHAEGFSILALPYSRGQLIVVAGNDARGELFGAGYLLRQLSFAATRPRAPRAMRLFSAPEKPVRGHQIGYRNKNNTYDAWTLPQFEQQIRDLAIFGANAIQLIAPVSDDAATSPLYPAPPLETLLGISAILAKYGLDCDLYYPELRDYARPENVAAELGTFEGLVRAMPRLDALYIPGGDPGDTDPEVLFPLIQREAAILRRYHPKAAVWVSAQGFDRDRYERFYRLLGREPAWLTGVFFGPQSRDSFFTQRRRVPARYAMQFYPDIGHTMHSQFPVPRWDPIFALAEGREPICPRPAAFAHIYRRFEPLHSGFVTYSEGVNDDVNKILFTQLGWSSAISTQTVLAEYARWFLGLEGRRNTLGVEAIEGLEADWSGPLVENRQIPRTLALLSGLDGDFKQGAVAAVRTPRWESLLYRATYDDYLQHKLLRERATAAAALAALADPALASSGRARAARRALASTQPSTVERQEHDRLFALADRLFHDWGLQLSVKLYHAENWERGANLDRVDTPLTEAAWLAHAIADALREPAESQRLAALEAIVHWRQPAPGALYDDLGDPSDEPHLQRGPGWAADPEFYQSANDSIADRTLAANPSPENPSPADAAPSTAPWRLSWIDYAETIYETPLTLVYKHLDPRRSYRVRVTYAGEDYALPLRLTANDAYEIHPARLRRGNPETVEFAIPAAATASGSLKLAWTGPQGSGGSGRGRQVAEVWLLPGAATR